MLNTSQVMFARGTKSLKEQRDSQVVTVFSCPFLRARTRAQRARWLHSTRRRQRRKGISVHLLEGPALAQSPPTLSAQLCPQVLLGPGLGVQRKLSWIISPTSGNSAPSPGFVMDSAVALHFLCALLSGVMDSRQPGGCRGSTGGDKCPCGAGGGRTGEPTVLRSARSCDSWDSPVSAGRGH